MAFVLVQHLDPHHQSQLAEILSRSTSLPVHESTNDELVKPDRVYVIPRNRNLTLVQGVLKVLPRDRTARLPRPIDSFFESLAQDCRERAVGVVLSGTANDGTMGLEAIKAEGGITFAQDDSAKYDSMPRSAVAAGCVDMVLSPAEIARELARIGKHPYVLGSAALLPGPGAGAAEGAGLDATDHEDDDTALPSGGKGSQRTDGQEAPAEAQGSNDNHSIQAGQDGYEKILLLLRKHSGVDFSLYRSSTIQRRVLRRLVLSKRRSLEEYAAFLRGNTKELDALYSDVLISVTSFFRNPETFEILEHKVLPQILKERDDDPVRCWVLGCSTGQEAYSIAIAFAEVAEKASRSRGLQIFATDLNEALLTKARDGLYAKSLANDISPERLRRFFVEEEGGYRVSKSIRESVVFARQNLIADPPFSRMDLISCRNLLIYLESDLQRKALPTFHYALKPRGFLVLGASESIGTFGDLFEAVDKRHKVFSKKPTPTPALALPTRKHNSAAPDDSSAPLPVRKPEASTARDGTRELNAQREADRITISQFGPPGVLVNADLQILQFRGPTSAFLEPPVGKATLDVLRMAREGLMLPLRRAINRAKKTGKPTRVDDVHVKRNGKSRAMSVEVIPLKNLRERCFLILFEQPHEAGGERDSEASPPAVVRASSPRSEEQRRIAQLEAELAELREYDQSMQDSKDAANEELQAANEEVQSANEELQSINEELETSKEELESANEELTTVNDEMSNRYIELGRLNDDLVNLQVSTKVAVLLLGRDLSIRRFSPQAETQLDLLAADLGRPIGQVRHRLLDEAGAPFDLEELAGAVVTGLREQEREVVDRSGRWISLRARPYLTRDNKVDGVTVVLADIDTLKRSEQAMGAARDYAERIVDTVREPLLVLDRDLRIQRASRAFFRVFGVAEAATIGQLVYEIGNRQWDIPRLRQVLAEVGASNATVEDFEVEHEFESIGLRTMLLNARRIQDPLMGSPHILLAIEDISERKRAEQALRDSETQLRLSSGALADAAARRHEFLAMLGHELRNPLSALAYGLEQLGQTPADEARFKEVRAMMVRQVQHIGSMLDQLLDIARVVSGKVELSKGPVDLSEVVRSAVEAVTPLLEARKHQITVTLPPRDHPAVVMGDPIRLIQVVENLLTNAAKYTDQAGRIAVTLTANGNNARIAVRDNGIGIDAELLPHIFEVFTQGPRALDRSQGGLGLGLPLVRSLVEMHGGQVGGESGGAGHGSEFVVTLPRTRANQSADQGSARAARERPKPRKDRPLRILVVDDQEDIANVLANLLQKTGHQTLAVADGEAALQALGTFNPQVVLLDLGLPRMDGYEVARRLRQENGGTKILLIAASGYSEDKARLKEAGFDHHLLKPLDMKKLLSLLAAA